MKMRKIIAILAAALMLFSILPISAMAAEDVTIALAGSTGTLASDSSSISWTSGGYTFTNFKGSTAIRTSDSAHYRVYSGSTVTVSGGAMSQVVITATSASYATVLGNSTASGWTITVNDTVATYTPTGGSAEELSFSATAQTRVTQIVITPADGSCAHEYVSEETKAATCTEDGELTYTCSLCGNSYTQVIAASGHDYVDGVCSVCGAEEDKPTPENPVDPENPQTYTFSDYTAGTQYAENEAHYLDNAITVTTTKAHFTTQLRLYSSSTNNGYAIITSTKDISAIILNAGNKVDTLNVYVSEDGDVYEAVAITSTAYTDYTVLIPEMTKYIKLDVAGTNQIRIASMTLYFDGETPDQVVCTEHTYTSDYDATCNTCNELREVSLPAADSTLTLPEATALGAGLDQDGYTTGKYYITGVVTAIDDTYGNTTIQDEDGNTFYSYGLNNFSTLEEKPVVGDTVTLYGVIGNYKGSAQTKYPDLTNLVKHTCVSNSEYECTDGTCTICGATVAGIGHSYFYPCDIVCQICYAETNPDATHNIVAVEAKEATCTENGNIAYWYCSDCGAAWADEALTQMTNRFNVIVPAGHTYDDNCDMDCNVCGEWRDAPHNLTEKVEAVVPANCQEQGNPEYWICEDCGGSFQDNGWGGYSEVNPAWLYYTGEHVRPEDAIVCAVVPCELCGADTYGESCTRPEGDPVCQDSTCVNCGETIWGWGCNYNTGDEETPLPLCQAGTCVYCGTEYEYLYECENGAWAPCQDGECSYGCGKQYPATASHTLEDCTVDGNCSVCWSYIPAGEHTYDHSEDTDCNVCGAIRPVDYMISNFDGNSISEDVSGLAFKYTMEISGIGIKAGKYTQADYTNATVTLNSVSEPVKVLGMGAIVSNNYDPTLIEYVDGKHVIDVPCVYLYDLEENTASFAVRIINIPESGKDTDISVRPYLIYEDQFGNVIYWYGLEDCISYNQVAG